MEAGITPPERRSSVTLRDGRKLSWCEWGLANGLPVLFCTAAGMSGYLGVGANHLSRTGQRLLAVDRPGLGASDPHEEKTLLTWTDDIRQMLEALDLRDAGAVGFSQGAPFALALGWNKVVNCVAVVAGQDDFSHATMASLLHPSIEGMVSAIRNDAAGFERYFAGIATAEVMLDLIVGISGEKDQAFYRSEPFAEALRTALREGFSQGAGGYARDLVNAMGAWPFQLEDIAVPVDLWYGALDASIAHSPDFGATMESRLPDARRELDFNEGASILWTKSGEILERLRRNQTTRKP